MKQGRADRSGPADQKVEPRSTGVNPGAVSYMGEKLGNHADTGSFPLKTTPMYNGRGYEAPMAGSTNHKTGSQGKH